jgi:hypothetical protein
VSLHVCPVCDEDLPRLNVHIGDTITCAECLVDLEFTDDDVFVPVAGDDEELGIETDPSEGDVDVEYDE